MVQSVAGWRLKPAVSAFHAEALAWALGFLSSWLLYSELRCFGPAFALVGNRPGSLNLTVKMERFTL